MPRSVGAFLFGSNQLIGYNNYVRDIYTGVIILEFIFIGILELNNAFTTLLGAAGILGIALGIVSQASIGNIIGGIFLISGKPFEIVT